MESLELDAGMPFKHRIGQIAHGIVGLPYTYTPNINTPPQGENTEATPVPESLTTVSTTPEVNPAEVHINAKEQAGPLPDVGRVLQLFHENDGLRHLATRRKLNSLFREGYGGRVQFGEVAVPHNFNAFQHLDSFGLPEDQHAEIHSRMMRDLQDGNGEIKSDPMLHMVSALKHVHNMFGNEANQYQGVSIALPKPQNWAEAYNLQTAVKGAEKGQFGHISPLHRRMTDIYKHLDRGNVPFMVEQPNEYSSSGLFDIAQSHIHGNRIPLGLEHPSETEDLNTAQPPQRVTGRVSPTGSFQSPTPVSTNSTPTPTPTATPTPTPTPTPTNNNSTLIPTTATIPLSSVGPMKRPSAAPAASAATPTNNNSTIPDVAPVDPDVPGTGDTDPYGMGTIGNIDGDIGQLSPEDQDEADRAIDYLGGEDGVRSFSNKALLNRLKSMGIATTSSVHAHILALRSSK